MQIRFGEMKKYDKINESKVKKLSVHVSIYLISFLSCLLFSEWRLENFLMRTVECNFTLIDFSLEIY